MSYLFVNPEVKKWKTLFMLSALLNAVMAIALYVAVAAEAPQTETTSQKSEPQKQLDESPDAPATNTTETAPLTKRSEPPATAKGEPLRIDILVHDNFFSSFTNSKAVKKLAEQCAIPRLDELLSAHAARLLIFDLLLRKDVRNGDRIRLVFRQIPEEEKATRNDLPDLIEILALEYTSKKLNKTIRIFQFKKQGNRFSHYYYADGQRIDPMLQPTPIKQYIQVTATLRDRRPKHDGVDFKAPTGTPVYSTVDGTVLRTNWKRRYNGYCIELKDAHSNHTIKYLHMSNVIVEPGQTVKIGQHIGNSGNTGKSTAPHLHYQINVGSKGKVLNPFSYHKTKAVLLSGKSLTSFKESTAKYRRILSGE